MREWWGRAKINRINSYDFTLGRLAMRFQRFHRFDGEVSLCGKRRYTGVTPRVDDKELILHRLRLEEHQGNSLVQIASEGPHFETWCINTRTLTLTSIGAAYGFTGAHLGTMSTYYGYAAADLGGGTRPIEELVFRKTFHGHHTEFDVSGICGALLFPNRESESERQISIKSFHVRFLVPDNELTEWCSCGEALLAQKVRHLTER